MTDEENYEPTFSPGDLVRFVSRGDGLDGKSGVVVETYLHFPNDSQLTAFEEWCEDKVWEEIHVLVDGEIHQVYVEDLIRIGASDV